MSIRKLPSRFLLGVDGIECDVTRKPIRNIYIRVRNPGARVMVSAPARMSDADIALFVRSHRQWIERNRTRALAAPEVSRMTYQSGEIHRIWGVERRLVVLEGSGRQRAVASDSEIQIRVRPGVSQDKRRSLLEAEERRLLVERIPELIARWEPTMGVIVTAWGIKRMRTRWGTCNIRAKRIWLNLALVRFPPECLEYVVVHEMNHLLERGHTARFYALMDQWLPDWKNVKRILDDESADLV
jgi:predicted metal-dependent hydrolase